MITAAFQQLKTNLELNDSFDSVVQQKHNAVRGVIQNFDPAITTKLIGSLQRKTRIQPRPDDIFDIDILVILGEFTGWTFFGGITPLAATETMGQIVRQSKRYSTLYAGAEPPATSLTYADRTKVELIPAYRDQIGHDPNGVRHYPVGRGYWIVKNGRWELADYDYDAEYITRQNMLSDNYLIPSIKMLKALKRQYFPSMSSFSLEIIAGQLIPVLVDVYKRYNAPVSYSKLIVDFFAFAPDHLAHPLRIPGSNTPAINVDIQEQLQLKNTFQKLKAFCLQHCLQGRDTLQCRAWKELFGSAFPN